MKQILPKSLWLRAMMLALVLTTTLAETARAEVESVTFSEEGYANQQGITSYEGTNFSVTFDKGTNTNAPKYYTAGTAIRVYGGGFFTVTSTNTITKIELTFGSSDGKNDITTDVDTYSDGTWTGSASSVKFTVGGNSGNRRLAGITVTYEASSSTAVATTTAIDASGITNTDVYVGTEAGTLSASVSTDDNAPVEGAIVTWSGDNDDVATIDAETGAVTLVGAGTVTFTATFAGVEDLFQASSDTYELTVTSSAPYVQPTTVAVNMDYKWLGSGSGANLSSNQLPVVKTDDNVKTTITDGTSTRPRGDADYIRLYKGSTITFDAPDGYIITQIEFTTGGTNTWNTPTPDSGELSGKTWTGEAESVEFTLNSGSCFISTATVTIEAIVPEVLSAITISGEYPSVFHVGDTFSSEGMTVTASYESGKTKDVTAEVNFSGYDMTAVGEQTVTVSYTESEVTKTATYTISVNAPASLTAITLSGNYPTEFQQGDAFSSEGIEVTASYDDNTTSDVTADATFSGYDMDALGNQTVTVTYEGQTATYQITVVERKGTAENPYSVAEARAAIDAGKGVTGVYAKGIVSKIVTAYNEQYGNISYNISADGSEEADQLQAFRGKSYSGAMFTSADDIQVGDTVVVYGNLKKYNSTYEFDADNQLVSLGRPVITTPYIEVSAEEITAPAKGLDGTIDVTYGNITNIAAEIFFCDANGNAATYDWIAADINSEDNVEYVIEENTSSEARTAYFKVYALDDEANDVYSDLITVTQAGYVVDYATLPFAFNGSSNSLPTGLTASGLGTDYLPTNAPNTRLKFDSTGDYMVLKIGEAPGTLAFDIKGNSTSGLYKFSVQVSADGETYTDLKTFENTSLSSTVKTIALALPSETRYIKWEYTTKVSGNVGLGNIKVVNWAETPAVGAAGYATYLTRHDVSFPSDVKAYIGKVNGEWLTLTKVTAVPAGTAVVLEAEAGAYTLAPADEGDLSDVSTNELKASDTDVKADGTQYILAKPDTEIGFFKAEGTIPAGKAYLEVTDSNVKGFIFHFDGDDATAICRPTVTTDEPKGDIFNLAGQRVSRMQKGLNIVGGKKILF